MTNYVMGVDVGTTGSKAIIFDLQGNLIASGYKEYTCIYPKPNWVEQDAVMLKEAVLEVCKKAVLDAQINPKEIAGISVSAQRCCLLFVDDHHNVLKMISWLDNRASKEVDILREEVGEDAFYKNSGMPLGTTWILPKIMWVQKNEPEIFEKTKKCVQLHDYILKCLGADDYYADEPDCAFWGFWDTDNLCFNKQMLAKYNINEELLPRVLASGTKTGGVSKEVAQATGLFAGTPLCVGGGDQNCAAIGAGVVKEGNASVSLGTGGLATVFMSKPNRDPKGKAMITNSAVHGCWQTEGLQNGAAGVFRWFRDEIADLEKHLSAKDGEDTYVKLNKLIESSPVGAKGLIFLPYLASAASPRYDEYARGTIIGLTFSHTKGDMARATIEGITMEEKDILTAIRSTGVAIEKIRIMGGATKSDVWNQIQADMYNCTVETLKITDSAVLGAAMCAAVGVGLYESIPKAAASLVRADKSYTPNKQSVQIYDEMYKIYCTAYESLADAGVYKGIANLQGSVV